MFLNQANFTGNKSFSLFNDLTNRINQSNEIVVSNFERLSETECSNLYRNSNLARKIINLYPEKAYNIGYEIEDKDDGKVIEKNNEIILEGFREASIYSRLYGHCFLFFEFSDNNRIKPLKPENNLRVTGFKLFYRMIEKIDFWEKDNVIYHKDRILYWKGVENRLPLDENSYLNDVIYHSDSILDSLVANIHDYFMTKTFAKYILENLSYLLVGMSGLSAKVASGKVGGKNAVEERMTEINLQRNVSRLFTYDLNNEKIDFISQTLGGVKELLQDFKETVADESEYPYEQLFRSTANNSMGSGAQNQLVERFMWCETKTEWVKNNWLPHYKKFFSKLYDMEKMVVKIPLKFEMTQIEKAELENLAADRIKKLIDSGVLIPGEGRSGYEGDEFDLNIRLSENYEAEMLKKVEEQTPNETELESNQDAFKYVESPNTSEWEELSNIAFSDFAGLADDTIKVNNNG